MSWPSPPPAVDKPLPPSLPQATSRRAGLVYAVSIALWEGFFQCVFFVVLSVRFILFRPHGFFPAHLLAWEFLTLAIGAVIGHVVSMRLLMLVLSPGKREE